MTRPRAQAADGEWLYHGDGVLEGGVVVDQALVQSGLDVEVLLSARFVRYTLLAQIEAGLLPTVLEIVDLAAGLDLRIDLHPPTDYDRRYVPDPAAVLPPAVDGSFDTQFVFGDADGANVQLSIVADIVDNSSGGGQNNQQIGLMLAVGLAADIDERGFERNHRLSVAFVKFDPLTVLGLALAGIDVDDVTERVRQQLDRTVPFGVASGQAVQRAVMQLMPGGGGRPPALGVYVNLVLKDGPEADAFVADRGDVAAAANFLDDGKDLAFATSRQLLDLIGPDLFHRLAEEDPPGSGNFRHPLREIPGDPNSSEKGRLFSVTARPDRDLVGQLTGRLQIDIAGEYSVDVLPDPNFHLLITLQPLIDADGLLTWDADASVDVGIFGSLLGALLIIGGLLLIGPGAAIAVFVLLVALDVVVDLVASAAAANRADELADASFLDVLPSRLTVATRRWDPLYTTRHQVVSRLTRFDVNDLGLAFDGVGVLDREPAPTAHAVIRDERRDADEVVALRYRVRDLGRIAADLAAVAPGTDRRPFTRVDPATDARNEVDLVELTLDQIDERIAETRLQAPILYLPWARHMVDHTIRNLLVVSKREVDEQQATAIDAFRSATAARIRAEQGEELAETVTVTLRADLGREPTEEELAAAVTAAIDQLVDSEQASYEQNGLAADVDRLVAAIARFDLLPAEFAELQLRHKALAIAGKEIIQMTTGTVYYRDRPDFFFADNLLALRTYRFPYVPPA